MPNADLMAHGSALTCNVARLHGLKNLFQSNAIRHMDIYIYIYVSGHIAVTTRPKLYIIL